MRGKDDALVTRNIAPGESVYNEKRVSVDVSASNTHQAFRREEQILSLKGCLGEGRREN
jgi:rRNA 2'-O-methyltransferase fibrillarin